MQTAGNLVYFLKHFLLAKLQKFENLNKKSSRQKQNLNSFRIRNRENEKLG